MYPLSGGKHRNHTQTHPHRRCANEVGSTAWGKTVEQSQLVWQGGRGASSVYLGTVTLRVTAFHGPIEGGPFLPQCLIHALQSRCTCTQHVDLMHLSTVLLWWSIVRLAGKSNPYFNPASTLEPHLGSHAHRLDDSAYWPTTLSQGVGHRWVITHKHANIHTGWKEMFVGKATHFHKPWISMNVHTERCFELRLVSRTIASTVNAPV